MVLDRGRPVAVLAPCAAPDSDLTELRDAGLARIGSGELPADFWTRPRDADPEASLRSALRADRESSW
jgi:antitoxin (DNA-binding transcriptional repressor) of toxin-antitoxin stability system